MTTYINPRGAAWGYFFPAKMKEYFQKYVLFENISQRIFNEWKRDYLFLLKKISFANKGKPLVLKSPPNTARIKFILSIFPNAKFVLIHRDPFEVFASNKRFLKITNWLYAIGTTKSMNVNTTITYTYAKTMQRYILEKHLIPNGQLIEIAYTDFIENPTQCIKKLYETLDLHEFSYCEKEMIEFEKGQESFKRLKHELSTEEKHLVSKELELIIQHWDY